MKNTSMIAILTLCVAGMLAATLGTTEADTSFNGSTVIGVDHSKGTITFRTREGNSWTLPVQSPELLKQEHVTQGKQVSIEINLDDQVTKILSPASDASPARPESRDDGVPQ